MSCGHHRRGSRRDGSQRLRHAAHQGVDALGLLVRAADEALLAAQRVEAEWSARERIRRARRQSQEEHVRLDRRHDLDTGQRCQATRKLRGMRIGAAPALEPAIVCEIALDLRRHEARLRQYLAAAPHQERHLRRERLLENDQHLGVDRAILGRAERQKVDARAPGDLGGGAAERCDGVREARAVHVHLEAVAVRDFGQS